MGTAGSGHKALLLIHFEKSYCNACAGVSICPEIVIPGTLRRRRIWPEPVIIDFSVGASKMFCCCDTTGPSHHSHPAPYTRLHARRRSSVHGRETETHPSRPPISCRTFGGRDIPQAWSGLCCAAAEARSALASRAPSSASRWYAPSTSSRRFSRRSTLPSSAYTLPRKIGGSETLKIDSGKARNYCCSICSPSK